MGEMHGALPPATTPPAPALIAAADERSPGLKTFVEFRGERKTVTAWAAELGIPKKTLAARLVNGWSPERALTSPFQTNKSHATPKVRPPAKTRTAPYIARPRAARGGRR